MAKVTVYGCGDDLIEVSGAITQEFYAGRQDLGYLAFSDGTVLRVHYDNGGVWVIAVVRAGSASVVVTPSGRTDSDYSDRATLDGDITTVRYSESEPAGATAVPPGNPEGVRLLLWDWRDGIDVAWFDQALGAVFNGSDVPRIIAVPNTHRDEYGALISATELDPASAQAIYDAWLYD